MAKMGTFSSGDLKKLNNQLNKLQKNDVEAFMEACAKELAARLLAKVIKRTPVGDYSKEIQIVAKKNSKNHKAGETYTKRINPSGKKGGTLRRGWTSASHEEAASGSGKSDVEAYVNSLKIDYTGGTYVIEIVNPVEYASYVEFGHRKQNQKGWVQGRFMLTISEQEIQNIAPNVIKNKIKQYLGECMK